MVISVKHESLSRTNESQFKKQTVNLKADSKTFYYIDNHEILGFLQ